MESKNTVTAASNTTFNKRKKKKSFFRSRWFYAGIFVVAAVIFYFYRQGNTAEAQTRYVLSAASAGNVVETISGTGQVSASDQVDIQPKITGKIISLNVVNGQAVKAGEVIAQLDDSDVQSQLRQAKNSLESARASLSLKLAGASEQDIALAQNSVDSAKLSYDTAVKNLDYVKQAAQDNLEKAQLNLENAQKSYDNAVSSSQISSTSVDQSLTKAYDGAKSSLDSALSSMRSALVSDDDILEEFNYTSASHNYRSYLGVLDSSSYNQANSAYGVARTAFEEFNRDYGQAALSWDKTESDEYLDKAVSLAQKMQVLAQAVTKVMDNSVASASFTQNTLNSYKQTASSQESAMLSQINALQSAKQAITNAQLGSSSSQISSSSSLDNAKTNLINAQKALAQAKLDNQKNIESANNDITNKKNSYENAKLQFESKTAKPRDVDLASYYIQLSSAQANYQDALDDAAEAEVKSPIDGVIAQVDKKVGDNVDSTDGRTIATVITEDKLATIALNEVDAAKVKVGQKATLTFSAIDGLTITGKVISVDSIGTISQGVVTYDVKISMDTQDPRIKPQMTVSADIAVNQAIDVLTVPSSAVKTDNQGNSYVETLDYQGQPSPAGIVSDNQPQTKYVTVGVSDGDNVEITNGLEEGDYVISRTISGSAGKSSSNGGASGNSLFGSDMRRASRF